MSDNSSNLVAAMQSWLSVTDSRPPARLTLDEETARRLESSLQLTWSSKQKLMRYAGNAVLNRIPRRFYAPVTTGLKRALGRSTTRPEPEFRPGPYMDALAAQTEPAAATAGKTFVCLTHDIDRPECAAQWRAVIELEERHGFRSTSNVLTNGPYALDRAWLDELQARGHEIGLHGDTHDMAIGFRDPVALRRRLQRCLERLDRPIRGFRAPALAITAPLLAVLDDLGFRYDSSVKANLFYSGGLDICAPFLSPGTRLWELPLVLQDDGLFRDRDLSDEEALADTRRIIALCRRHRGLFVLNTHPVNLMGRMGFYERLLRELVADESLEVTPAGVLVERLDQALDAATGTNTQSR